MLIYAVDPGNEESALVVYDDQTREIKHHAMHLNAQLVEAFINLHSVTPDVPMVLVVEKIESFGMAVGKEMFETVWWSGRFHQAWPWQAERLTRKKVKEHLCNSHRATDGNIRQSIYDIYGGKIVALGRKHAPGKLYGLKGHEYAALAVALTYAKVEP